MSHRLRSNQASPPGGFPYYQGGDKPHKFTSVPVIEDQAKAVSSYRTANNLPRASLEETLIDVDRYTCARIGNNPRFCIPCGENDPVSSAVTAPPPVGGCKGCGAVNHA